MSSIHDFNGSGSAVAIPPLEIQGDGDGGYFDLSFGTEFPARQPSVIYLRTKRILDVLLAVMAIVGLFPLLALVAVAIKLTDWGPVFFCQTRVGKHGGHFTLYKFRSMVPNAEQLKQKLMELNHHKDARTFKMADDPRITWVGRIIRRLSIDELPQLWNVIRGDMALVGPRPPIPSEVELYTSRDKLRLEVQPGLTCIWQIAGRGNLSFEEQVLMDLEYISRQSMVFDLKLILCTIPAVLSGRGAY